MSIDSLYPYAGDHAIQNAVFAVEFEGVLTAHVLRDVQKAAERALQKDFPTLVPQQTMSLNFELGAVAGAPLQQMKANPTPGGFVMSKLGGFGGLASRTLTLNVNSFVVQINDYSRWAQVKADVDRYLDVILKAVQAHGVAVRAVGLQYIDLFNWKTDPADLVVGEIFSRESPYLPANIFALPPGAMWHAHHGFLAPVLQPVAYNQLDNINVSRVDMGGNHALQILTSHRAQFEAPLWKISRENRHVISGIQESLHQRNKDIVSSLLTPEVRSKIKLS